MVTLSLAKVNPSFTCKLCAGYLRDAHTLRDCLHTFCRPCLERYIINTRRNDVVHCPYRAQTGCTTALIATHPMRTEVRYDRAMQNLVDKLLPQFAAAEEELKKQIEQQFGGGTSEAKRKAAAAASAAAQAKSTATAEGEPAAKKARFGDDKLSVGGFSMHWLARWRMRVCRSPTNLVFVRMHGTADLSVCVLFLRGMVLFFCVFSGHDKLMIFELRPYVPPTGSPAPSTPQQPPLGPLQQPFVKTSAKVTVKHLRKFIAERLGLMPPASATAGTAAAAAAAQQVPALDLMCSGEVLGQDHSVEFIWRTRWHHLHPNQHLVLTYRYSTLF
jgi:DNA-binding transcriptional regulator YdaS (Cro superfamily)